MDRPGQRSTLPGVRATPVYEPPDSPGVPIKPTPDLRSDRRAALPLLHGTPNEERWYPYGSACQQALTALEIPRREQTVAHVDNMKTPPEACVLE